MEPLIDSFDTDKWETIDVSAKGEGFKEYQVMRQHKEEGAGCYKYYIQEEDGDPKTIVMDGCKSGHDPLKNIGTIELKLKDDGTVAAVDLNGDCVVHK